MGTIRLTMGQALLRFMSNQYISIDSDETLFVGGVLGIFGHGNVVGLGEALAQGKHSFRFFQAKNEQGAAHIAIGYAKQNGRKKVMAVTSSIGPGALNMVTAAGTATVNRIPLLLLPGDAFACRQPDPVLQQVERFDDYTVTANDSFKAVSKYWDRVVRPEQLMTAMLHAFRVLTDPAETGAVTIALPQDVQGEPYDYPEEFFERRVHYVERRIPGKAQIDRACSLIRSAKRPLVICGGGVRYSGAEKELAEFCTSFGIPFGETQAGKGSIAASHPLNLSGIGTTGSLAANRLAKEADLVIAVGTRLGDFTTCSKWLFQEPHCKFLALNVTSFDCYKMNALPLLADAKLALAELTKKLGSTNYRAQWGKEIADVRAEWDKEVAAVSRPAVGGILSQMQVLTRLNTKLLPPETIIVAGSGSIPSDMQRAWKAEVQGSYHLEYGFSCMGYEIAASLGAKIADPRKEVVAIVGDGAYTMLHSELLTSIQEGLKIIVIVLDNSGFHCIDNLQASQGIVHFANEWRQRDGASGNLSGRVMEVDYAKNAESWGAIGISVRTVEELDAAVSRALASASSVVIDVKVSPKSMSHGYESWWRVGTAQVSENPDVAQAAAEIRNIVPRLKKF